MKGQQETFIAFGVGAAFGLLVQYISTFVVSLFVYSPYLESIYAVYKILLAPGGFVGAGLASLACGQQGSDQCQPFAAAIIGMQVGQMISYGLIFLLLYLIYRKFKPSPANSG